MVLSLLAHSFFYILFLKTIYFFIFGCAGSLLLHAEFLQLQKRGAKLCFNARASHCRGLSIARHGPCVHALQQLHLEGLQHVSSRVLTRGCVPRAWLLRGAWSPPSEELDPIPCRRIFSHCATRQVPVLSYSLHFSLPIPPATYAVTYLDT